MIECWISCEKKATQPSAQHFGAVLTGILPSQIGQMAIGS
jgi:hypothetical protein